MNAREARTLTAAVYEAYEATRDNTPEETIAAVAAALGKKEAREAIALLIVTAHDDGRISDRNKEWSRDFSPMTWEECRAAGVWYRDDKMHKVHADQIANAARRYDWTEPEPVAEECTEAPAAEAPAYTIGEGTKPGAVEVKFAAKPDETTREALKALSFRWNGKKAVWYGFASAEVVAAALNGAPIEKPAKATKKTAALAPLFERFSVADLPAYGTSNPMKEEARENARKNDSSYDKEAAKIIRAHLRARFPECKFSVTSGGSGWLNCVDISVKSAPWGKIDSVDRWGDPCKVPGVELSALLDYCNALHDAFDADDGDIYADYGAHHDLYGSAGIDWQFTQTEPTAEQAAQVAEYREALKAEEARKEEAYKTECETYEREQAIAAELNRARIEYENNKAAEVAAGVVVEDVEPFRLSGLVCGIGKECTLEEVKRNAAERNQEQRTAEIVRRVTFPETGDAFAFFCSHLLRDWEFVAGMGGSATDDPRINDMEIYYKLNAEQRSDVEWYASNAVAIYQGDTLKMVIDPQGYDYPRYVYLTDNATPAQETEREYKPFYIPAPLTEQAQSLAEGAEISLLTVDPWMMSCNVRSGEINAIRIGKYAQYDNCLFITYTPEGKRKNVTEVIRPGQEAAIFSGYLPGVPSELSQRRINENMVELLNHGGNANKFLHNCVKYYKSQGYTALVDTIPA